MSRLPDRELRRELKRLQDLQESLGKVKVREIHTRRKFIDPLLKTLRWDKSSLEPEAEEFAERPRWRDYHCYLHPVFKSPFLVIEAKRIDTSWNGIPQGLSTLGELGDIEAVKKIREETDERYRHKPFPQYYLATNGYQFFFYKNPRFFGEEKTPVYFFDGFGSILGSKDRFNAFKHALEYESATRAFGLERLLSNRTYERIESEFTPEGFERYLKILKREGVEEVYVWFRGAYHAGIDREGSIATHAPFLDSFHFCCIIPKIEKLRFLETTFFLRGFNSIYLNHAKVEEFLARILQSEEDICALLRSNNIQDLPYDDELKKIVKERGGKVEEICRDNIVIPNDPKKRESWLVIQGDSSSFLCPWSRRLAIEGAELCSEHRLGSAKAYIGQCLSQPGNYSHSRILNSIRHNEDKNDRLLYGTRFYCDAEIRYRMNVTKVGVIERATPPGGSCWLTRVSPTGVAEGLHFCCGYCRFYEKCQENPPFKCQEAVGE